MTILGCPGLSLAAIVVGNTFGTHVSYVLSSGLMDMSRDSSSCLVDLLSLSFLGLFHAGQRE